MNLKEIQDSAPEGATHYYMQKGVVLHYMMKYREDWYRYSESNKKYRKLMITSVSDVIPLYEEATTTESILSERQAQYGNYSDVARITQEIKKSLLSGASYSNLSDEQKLSLDMIANKMARAVNGDVTYVDNWQDICGYSQLVVDSLNS